MSNLREVRAEQLIEAQCEVYSILEKIRQHSTVRSNPTLRDLANAAIGEIRAANMTTCLIHFPGDTLRDLGPTKAA